MLGHEFMREVVEVGPGAASKLKPCPGASADGGRVRHDAMNDDSEPFDEKTGH